MFYGLKGNNHVKCALRIRNMRYISNLIFYIFCCSKIFVCIRYCFLTNIYATHSLGFSCQHITAIPCSTGCIKYYFSFQQRCHCRISMHMLNLRMFKHFPRYKSFTCNFQLSLLLTFFFIYLNLCFYIY